MGKAPPGTKDDYQHLAHMRSFVAESISAALDRAESGLDEKNVPEVPETSAEI